MTYLDVTMRGEGWFCHIVSQTSRINENNPSTSINMAGLQGCIPTYICRCGFLSGLSNTMNGGVIHT